MENPNQIHLIVQYYRCASPERQAEIDTCLRNNLLNPYLTSIHLLTEEQFDLASFPNIDKIIQTVIGERLTYERAFQYANGVDPTGQYVWILNNADIYFDDSIKCLCDVDLNRVVFALTRHDVQADGSVKLVDAEFAHGCQDTWIFKTKLPLDRMFSSFYLGIPGCDHRIAYEFVHAGYIVLNPANKITARHLDLSRNIDINERTKSYVALMTEEGFKSGKAAPRPYQYFLYPTDKLEITPYELYLQQLEIYAELYSKSNLLTERDRHIAELAELLRQKDVQLMEKESQLEDIKRSLAAKETQVNALKNSLSWRVTKPLRFLHEKLVPQKDASQNKPSAARHPNNYFSQLVSRAHDDQPRMRSVSVDIIIPVYNGYDVTKACVESVLQHSENCRVIIIDDASPDGRIPALLNVLTGIPEKNLDLLVLRNEKNLGFVKSVNKAFAHTHNHFAILNSDTEVPPGWLDRLFAPIIDDDRIATVTPFSNAATICSFPEISKDNPLFRGVSVSILDSYFNRFGSSQPVEIPTGVGFCMAINRNLAKNIGLFDEAAFGRGYGEENDFCQRAAKKGYRNVIVPNLFVYHKHGGSFNSAEKRALTDENNRKLVARHPDYPGRVAEFGKADPLRDIREALMLIIAAREGKENKTVSIVDFDLGGGSGVYSQNLVEHLSLAGHKVVHLKYHFLEKCLYIDYRDNETIRVILPEAQTGFIDKIMQLLEVDYIMVNQLVSWPEPTSIFEKVLESGIPFLVFIHDFFWICPNFALVNKECQFCGIPADKQVCAECLLQNDLFNIPIIYESAMQDVGLWREKIHSFLVKADKVVCFSESTRNHLLTVYQGLGNSVVNEHYIPQPEQFTWKLRSFKDPSLLSIAVIGCINRVKGNSFLQELLASQEFQQMPVRIVVIGTLQPMPEAQSYPDEKLIVHGEYRREQLASLLEAYGISMVMIPSIWPETFSYTTSEAILLGYPVLCFNIGAPADRVRRYDCGFAVDAPYTDNVLTTFRRILAEPDLVETMSQRTKNYVPNSLEEHFTPIEHMISGAQTL